MCAIQLFNSILDFSRKSRNLGILSSILLATLRHRNRANFQATPPQPPHVHHAYCVGNKIITVFLLIMGWVPVAKTKDKISSNCCSGFSSIASLSNCNVFDSAAKLVKYDHSSHVAFGVCSITPNLVTVKRVSLGT